MYNVGDSVVYPLHGAGVIEAIEEREVSGEIQKYYVMRIPFGDMKVLFPVSGVDKIGVRNIISREKAGEVIEMFRQIQHDVSVNWNKRFRDNMVKVKSGNVFDVAEVVKALMLRDKLKGLSTGERKMLANAKQILISEIVIASGQTYEEVDDELKGIVSNEMQAEQVTG